MKHSLEMLKRVTLTYYLNKIIDIPISDIEKLGILDRKEKCLYSYLKTYRIIKTNPVDENHSILMTLQKKLILSGISKNWHPTDLLKPWLYNDYLDIVVANYKEPESVKFGPDHSGLVMGKENGIIDTGEVFDISFNIFDPFKWEEMTPNNVDIDALAEFIISWKRRYWVIEQSIFSNNMIDKFIYIAKYFANPDNHIDDKRRLLIDTLTRKGYDGKEVLLNIHNKMNQTLSAQIEELKTADEVLTKQKEEIFTTALKEILTIKKDFEDLQAEYCEQMFSLPFNELIREPNGTLLQTLKEKVSHLNTRLNQVSESIQDIVPEEGKRSFIYWLIKKNTEDQIDVFSKFIGGRI